MDSFSKLVFLCQRARTGLKLRTKIQKWGNSLGLRIPKSFAEEASLKEGSTVDLSIEKKSLVVKALPEKRFDLTQLVSAIRDDNLHEEVATGEAVRRESW